MKVEKKCRNCGSSSVSEGMVGSGHANVKNINKNLSIGSKLFVTFCINCGEVQSMRVENPKKAL
ncbi:putative Zn finger protein [Anoxybacillus tepidamans]|uniref:Putative Zn finger protein n=1 Tax=Anoxybacteroides tepidamans TaxID=265948 RepID=A0A7W8IQ62_9BACL|nr:hypothetical protein [Anoxybacillus tepidamans]MBB5324655.1 putative Zn finger protein [Anoxybacillus tepidamans]